jgi:hypothetical protein
MTVTFSKSIKVRGSNQVRVNVDRNGQPYGQIWTFRNTATEKHVWHFKTLSGLYQTFQHLRQAKAFAEHLAG